MNKLTAAYLAGLIDGEGYLGIQKNPKESYVGGYAHVGVIKICMTDEVIIRWLKDSFGGNFYEREGKDGRKNSYEWCIRHGKNITPFLSKIYPYLKVKKQQAEVLKKFLKTFDDKYKIVENKLGNSTGVHKELKDETRQNREKLYWQLRELKKL
jgi:hypothetical protein